MKHLTIIFFFLLTIFSAKSQNPEANYLKVYHPVINIAEKSVMDNNYKAALEAYQKAFAAVPKAFMKDYFNAAVCATYLGDATNTYKYLLEVANKGISLDFIKDETAFIGIQQDPNWREFEKQYLAKKRDFDSKISKSIKDKLNRIVERSNWFRSKNGEVSADSLKKIDAQNATELDYLIARYGFPDEEMLGCGEGGMPIVQYPFYTIFRQQAPDNQTINFSNVILEAMRKGKISPHVATHIMANMNGTDAFFARHVFKLTTDDEILIMKNKPFSQKMEKWVYRKLTPDEELNFNALRLANGLESMSDYRKKIAFSLKDNRFLFPYKVFTSMWYVSDPNIASDYLQDTVVLE
jgi:hypothetical protein